MIDAMSAGYTSLILMLPASVEREKLTFALTRQSPSPRLLAEYELGIEAAVLPDLESSTRRHLSRPARGIDVSLDDLVRLSEGNEHHSAIR